MISPRAETYVTILLLYHVLGNCAVIKPSEVSENTSKALAALLPRYLDKVIKFKCT